MILKPSFMALESMCMILEGVPVTKMGIRETILNIIVNPHYKYF